MTERIVDQHIQNVAERARGRHDGSRLRSPQDLQLQDTTRRNRTRCPAALGFAKHSGDIQPDTVDRPAPGEKQQTLIPAFWAAYILTRPLGASTGDYLSQPRDAGGLGLGTVGTSAIFLTTILAIVLYLGAQQRKRELATAAGRALSA